MVAAGLVPEISPVCRRLASNAFTSPTGGGARGGGAGAAEGVVEG